MAWLTIDRFDVIDDRRHFPADVRPSHVVPLDGIEVVT
jgi:hypothetical protein